MPRLPRGIHHATKELQINKPSPEIVTSNSIVMEIDNTLDLFRTALFLLQRSALHNQRTFPTIILLSSAYERLLKIVLVLVSLHRGRRLTKQDLQNKGHSSRAILDELLSTVSAVDSDLDTSFLASDESFRAVIEFLSEFAAGGRYSNLDRTSNPGATIFDPNAGWKQVGQVIVGQLPASWEGGADREHVKAVGRRLVMVVERSLHAISALFRESTMGKDSARYSSMLGEFRAMTVEDFGKREYEP